MIYLQSFYQNGEATRFLLIRPDLDTGSFCFVRRLNVPGRHRERTIQVAEACSKKTTCLLSFRIESGFLKNQNHPIFICQGVNMR